MGPSPPNIELDSGDMSFLFAIEFAKLDVTSISSFVDRDFAA